MRETPSLTIDHEHGGDGWIVASIPEVPGAHSQGRTRQEARENAIDALHGILELRFGEHALSEPALDSETLAARRGPTPARVNIDDGPPLIRVPAGTPAITPEMVRRGLEEE